MSRCALVAVVLVIIASATTSAQRAAFRVKGYVRDDKAAAVANADVRIEAFSGYFAVTWDVVLKPVPALDDQNARFRIESAQAAHDGHADAVRASLQQLPADADADYPAGAGRVAMVARDFRLARSLFGRAIERDPLSYRATLGPASTFLYDRDFDSTSRAFDAARNRTNDKEEQRFISAAIGDLATIKVR